MPSYSRVEKKETMSRFVSYKKLRFSNFYQQMIKATYVQFAKYLAQVNLGVRSLSKPWFAIYLGKDKLSNMFSSILSRFLKVYTKITAKPA